MTLVHYDTGEWRCNPTITCMAIPNNRRREGSYKMFGEGFWGLCSKRLEEMTS